MSLLALVVGAHLAVVLWHAIAAPIGFERPLQTLAAAAIAALATIAIARTSARRGASRRAAAVARAAIVALFLATRLAWAIGVDTQPVSDFAGYYALARAVAHGEPIFMPWPLGGAVAAWGYPLALGFALRLAPGWAAELLVAKAFNVLLGCASLLLLDRFVRRIADERTALVAMLLFALWPGQLYLTSVLATEHLAVPMLLSALLLALDLLASWRERGGFERSAIAASVGIALAISVAVRSALIATAGAVLIALWRWRVSVRQALVSSAVVVATLVLATTLYRTALLHAYGATPLDGTWWSLLTGTNLASGGSFSAPDRDRFFAHRTIEEANAVARAEIARRIVATPLALAHLAWVKTVKLWVADDYAVFWSTERIPETAWQPGREPMAAAAHAAHVASLALAVLGCVVLARRAPRPGTDLLLLLLVCGTLLHAAAESQARYHFVLEPLVLALAAIGACPARRSPSNHAPEQEEGP